MRQALKPESRVVPQFQHPLHLRCGDDILGKLRRAGLPGQMTKWGDVLSLGPTPADLTQDEWYDVRARFIAESYHLAFEDVRAERRAQDAALAKFPEHDAVILWFEHDLFDQIILVWLLQWFARQELGATQLRLICISSFPGVERFVGLGQLTPEELGTLYGTSEAVTAGQLALAREVWAAWCSADPTALERVMNGGTSALPFLRAALLRHLQDFPSVRNGLSLTEQMALEVLSEGPRRAQHLFCAVADSEAAPWMGDAMFYAEIERLRQGACPLMAAKSAGPIEHRTELEITAHGRDVSAGRADAVALNGVDRWIGGVHLNGHQVWRWDEQAQALIQ